MDEQKLPPSNVTSEVLDASESLDAANIDNMRVSDLSSSQSYFPVESIEVKQEPAQTTAQRSTHQFYASSFSRRRALIISLFITLIVTLITGGSILMLTRGTSQHARNLQTIKSEDVSLKNADLNTLPDELKTKDQSLLVHGDVITTGEIKLASGSFVTILRAQNANANQTFTLPDGSGTICLTTNNCNFATQTGLNKTNASVAAIQSQLNNLDSFVTPDIPAASLINNQAGVVSLQGTTNQVTITTNNGTIILSTPQDLASISSPTFANLALTNNFSLSGVVTLPIDCTSNANGGALTTNALGQIICSDDASGATTAVTSSMGGTAGTIPVFTASQNVENSILTQALGTIIVNGNNIVTGTATFSSTAIFNGNLTVQTGDTFTVNGDAFTDLTGSGLVVNSGSLEATLGTSIDLTVEVNGILPATNGGTGTSTVPTNGQVLVGNGSGYAAANIGNAGGVGITNGAGSLSLAVLYGSVANTAVQGNTNLTCAAGTGNLSGGGNSFALGTGGACADLSITNSPNFTTSVTTPQLLLTGTGSNATLVAASLGQPTTYILPDSGGASTTLCIISNNCNYQAAGSYVNLQNSTPGTAQTGSINIDGTIIAGNLAGILNGVTVSNAGTSQFTITGGTPTSRTLTVTSDVDLNQSLLTTSSVTFNQLTLTTALSVGNGGTGLSSAPANGKLLIGNGSSFTLSNLASADNTITITSGSGTIDLSVPTAGTCAGCANVSLSNLSGVAINTSLLSGAATVDLGSTTAAFRDIYLHGSGSFGTNSFRITGTPSGNRTLTLPSIDGTVALAQTAGSSTQQSGDLNVSGTFIAGTALQGTLFKTADVAGTSSALSIRSGNSSGGASGNITLDVGTAGTTAGTISIGGTTATGLTLGRSGVTTSLPGGINTGGANIATGVGTVNGQTISSSANFTGTLTVQGANALTLGTSSSNTGAIIFNNSSGTNTVTLKASNTNPASSVSLTLPTTLPVSTECLNLSATGQIGTQGCSSGLGGSGTDNTIAMFTSGGSSLTDSLLSQSGTVVSILGSANSLVVEGNITAGLNGASGAAGLISLHDGSNPGRTVSLQAQQVGTGYTLQLPTSTDVGSTCLTLVSVSAGVNKITGGACAAGGSGGNVNVSGTVSGYILRGTGNGPSYTAAASIIQDDGSTVGVNTAPQTDLFTVGSSNAFRVTNAGAISASASVTSSGLIQTSASNQALTLSGAPGATANQSLIEIGNAIANGNVASNGGTYLGLNAPNSGAGSAADFLNFQKNGVSKLLVTNTGDITAGKLNGLALAQGANQFTVNGGTGTARTLTVSGDAIINQDLSTTSNTVAFGKINSLTTKLEASQGGTGSNLSGSLAGAVAIFNATTDKFETARLRSSDNSLTINSSDGDIDLVVQSCSTCANTSLSNLTGTTSVNSDLLAQAGKNLGSATSPFQSLFIYGSGTYGSHSIELTGTPTGNRVLTLPDVTANVCVSTNNCGYQATGNYVLLSPASQQTGYINLSGNVNAGTFNNLTIAPASDGFTITGGTTPRTLTVTNAAVTLNQSLQTTDSVSFNSLSTSTITTAIAGTASAISIQPGASTAVNGSGANLSLKGGDQSGTTCNATNCTGGGVTVQGGNASGASGTTRNGGNVTIDAGIGATANGNVTIGTSNALSVSVGRSVGTTTIQGSASSAITITNGASSTAVQFVNPTASVIYRFDTASAGTYTVCTTANLATTCLPSGGSGNYIQNQYSSTQTANFNIQSAASGQVTAVIKGAASQSVDILQVATNTSTVFSVSSAGNIAVGSATVNSTANLLVVDTSDTEPVSSISNGSMYYNSSLGRFRCYQQSAWKDCDVSSNPAATHSKTIVLKPEFEGAALNAPGVSGTDTNTGYMTSGLCSGTSVRSINTSLCAASDEHTFYQWSTSESSAQTYDVYVRWQIPSDYSAMNTISVAGWRTTSSDTISGSLYDINDTSTPCVNGTSIASSNTTWTNTSLTLTGCNWSADGFILLKFHMSATSGNYSRLGEVTINYTSSY